MLDQLIQQPSNSDLSRFVTFFKNPDNLKSWFYPLDRSSPFFKSDKVKYAEQTVQKLTAVLLTLSTQQKNSEKNSDDQTIIDYLTSIQEIFQIIQRVLTNGCIRSMTTPLAEEQGTEKTDLHEKQNLDVLIADLQDSIEKMQIEATEQKQDDALDRANNLLKQIASLKEQIRTLHNPDLIKKLEKILKESPAEIVARQEGEKDSDLDIEEKHIDSSDEEINS